MKTKSESFLFEKELPWEPAGTGTERQIMGYDGQLMLVKVKFQKGAIGAVHTHYHTQSSFIVSGKFEFNINGEIKVVEPGDGLYIDPDMPHGLTCLETGVVIDCFSPMRADFIEKK